MSKSCEEENIKPLISFTHIFAQKICETIVDMTGKNFEVNVPSTREEQFHFCNSMVTFIHFYGAVQGDFIVVVNEVTALKIAGNYHDNYSSNDTVKYREYLSSLFTETLNIAVAQTLNIIEDTYENLTYFPAIVVFGDIQFPDVKSAYVEISGECGVLHCGFSLNLVRPKIALTLQDVEISLSKTKKLASTDALTGLYNRAFFDMNYDKYILEAKVKNIDLSMLIIDVDNFKEYNDLYGHQMGDKVLSVISEVILDKIRGADFGIRYGGDEFVVLLFNTECDGAYLVAERIRSTVKAKRIESLLNIDSVINGITLSIGVAKLRNTDDSANFFKRADNLLYRAKELGRDRVVTDE